ncbi:MAG: dihydrodipicolinate synthase family protein [Calditrichaeota bacterium]|nr:dihydrodipicolinate synthase family protein [Calditrichota bacterium]
MKKNFFEGVVTPMVTPFHDDGSLDSSALETFTNWLCEREVDVLFPMGGTGEYQTLNVEERKEIIRVVTETAGGRKKVVPGVGGRTLSETLTLVEEAQKAGADGVSVVIPAAMGEYAGELTAYYGKTASDFETLLNYYKKINSELDRPFMVYDSRGQLTETQMREFVAELSQFKGIKYRTNNEEHFADIVYASGDTVNVLSGIEFIYLGNLAMGAKGVVGGGANFIPHLMAKLKRQYEAGEVVAARETQYLLIAAGKSMAGMSWPLSAKLLLRKLGLPIEPVTRVDARKHPAESEARMLDFMLPLCK